MERANDRKTGPKRIGELLVSANIVKPEYILRALKESKASSRPVGRVLMDMGFLRESDLEAALELQSLLKDGLVSNQFGIRALNVAIRSDISLTDSFLKFGWQPPERPPTITNELAQLLLNAHIVSRKQMDEAIARSTTTKIPLGRCLVLNRYVSSTLLLSALTAQVLLRDGKITRAQAISALKAAFRKQQSIEELLYDDGALAKGSATLKVGNLLVSAGLISEGNKVSAIEQGLVKELPLGQVLLKHGLISQAVLNNALKIQELVNNNEITLQQGTELLCDSHARGMSVETILAEQQISKRDLERVFRSMALLEKAGILSESEIGQEEAKTVQHKAIVVELLQKSGRLPQSLLDAAITAQSLVEDQIIGVDQAIAVLKHCQRFGTDLHSALQNTVWEERSELS